MKPLHLRSRFDFLVKDIARLQLQDEAPGALPVAQRREPVGLLQTVHATPTT